MALSTGTGGKARYAGIGTEAVERATGRPWEAWIEALDREGAKTMTHKEIATMLREEYRLSSWWAQMVAVGYEQAIGVRVRGQRGGAFRVHASRTIAAEAPKVRAAWSEQGPGVTVRFNAKGEGKTQVVVDEEGLPDAAAVKRRKVFWREALDRLQAALE